MHNLHPSVAPRPIGAGQKLLVGLCALAWAATSLAQGRPTIQWMKGGHAAGIRSLAVSPDGTRLATASFDTTVKLFTTTDAILERTLLGHDVAAQAVAFLPSGNRVLSGGFEGLGIVWDVGTGAVVHTLVGHTGPVNAVAVSADGARMATASGDETVKIWSTSDGSLLRTLTGHSGWVYAVTFSPDGSTLVSGGADGTVRLWRVADGAPLGTLTAHAGAVLSVRFSPDGSRLLSCGTDDAVRMWRASDGALLATFTDQTMYVYTAVFSPDGTRLASGAGDGTIIIRRASDGMIEQTILTHAGVLDLAYSPDGTGLYAGTDNGMASLWNTGDGTFNKWITSHWGAVNTVRASQDSSIVISGADDGHVVVHTMANGDIVSRFQAHSGLITDAAISPDASLVCTVSDDFAARIWRIPDGTLVHELSGHTDTLHCAAFSPDGTIVATGSSDTTIRLWNVSDGSQGGVLIGHTGAVRSVAFSPDGQWLASCGADGTVRKWRLSDLSQVWQASTGAGVALSVAFSPDGTSIATGAASYGGPTLAVWNAADGTLLASAAQASDTVQSVAYSPDGLLIVSGGVHNEEGRLQIWQASNLALLQTFSEETGSCLGSTGVLSACFTPDRTGMLYGRFDGTVVLADNPFWPLPTRLTVSNTTGQVGELVTLHAILSVDIGGGPVMGKTVAFAVAGSVVGSAVTDASGVASCEFRIPESMGVGTQTIGGAFAGDDAYGPSAGTGTLTITRANTAVHVTSVAGVLGDPVVLSARLVRTTDDAPLAGRPLRFKVEGTSVGVAVTGETGYASVDYAIPIGSGAGDRLIEVSFDGDSNHLACTAYGTLTAMKRPTTTAVISTVARIGQVVELFASVTFRGVGVEGLSVDYSVDGTAVATGTTDASGMAVVGYLVPEASGVGQRTIQASFAGTPVYEASSGTGSLEVVRTSTFVYVPNLTRTVTGAGDAVLRGYLFRSTDRAGVAGRSVSFYVDGVLCDTQLTDENGRATGYYHVPAGASSADLTVRAVFDGDATYYPSEGTGRLTLLVQRTGTYLWVLPRIGVRGSGTYLRGYLRRVTDYAWLPGKTIRATVDGTYVGEAVTNSDGRASVFYRIPDDLEVGYHTITMTFAGDDLYEPSTGEAPMLVL